MARGFNLWFLLVVILVAYALIPGVQNFVNSLLAPSSTTMTPQDSPNMICKRNNDDITGFLIIWTIFILVIGSIITFAGIKIYQKWCEDKNGGHKESKSSNKKPQE